MKAKQKKMSTKTPKIHGAQNYNAWPFPVSNMPKETWPFPGPISANKPQWQVGKEGPDEYSVYNDHTNILLSGKDAEVIAKNLAAQFNMFSPPTLDVLHAVFPDETMKMIDEAVEKWERALKPVNDRLEEFISAVQNKVAKNKNMFG